MVGTSARIGDRLTEAMASARSRPDWTFGRTFDTTVIELAIWPARKS
jgi:hypothetical protein